MHEKRAQRQQQQQKRYYDRSVGPQSVRIQEHGLWKPAVVIQPADTEHSYYVRAAIVVTY